MKKYLISWSIFGLIIGSIFILYVGSNGWCDYDINYVPKYSYDLDCKITLLKSTIKSSLTYILILIIASFSSTIGFIHWKIKSRKN